MRRLDILLAALFFGSSSAGAEIKRRQPIEKGRFLHIPKTGTSFIICLRNAISECHVKDFTCPGLYGGGCVSNKNCGLDPTETMALAKATEAFISETPVDNSELTCNQHLLACNASTYHAPFDREYLLGQGPNDAYVTMVREPVELMISLAKWWRPEIILAPDNATEWEACRQGKMKHLDDVQVKMLLGHHHLKPPPAPLEDVSVRAAFANLLSLDFFGDTDLWSESVCLFHAVFGGEPRPAEFLNVRKGLAVEVPPRVREMFVAMTRRDAELYALARAHLAERLEEAAGLPDFQRCMEMAPKAE